MRRSHWGRAALLLGLVVAATDVCRAAEAPRLDGLGDPLPPGAVLRLGNVRFLQEGDVAALAFTPDGKYLATADSGCVRLWDPDSGKKIRCLGSSQGSIQALAFSRDGKMLAAAVRAAIHLWDVRASKQVGRLQGHGKGVHCLAFSPDGTLLASGGEDKTVRLWDIRTRKEVRRCPGKPGAVRALCFFPDGGRLALGSPDEGIHLWHIRGDPQLQHLQEAGLGLQDLALSPDGRTLASAHLAPEDNRGGYQIYPFTSFQHVFCLWDTASGKKLKKVSSLSERYSRWSTFDSGFDRLAFSPDGVFLVGGGFGPLCWWDTAKRRVIRRSEETMDSVVALTVSPDARTLACAQEDNRVRLWDVRTGKQRHPWQGHTRAVTSVAFAPDGKALATAGRDGTVRIWDLATGKERLCLPLPGRVVGRLVSYSPDGSVLGGLADGLGIFRGAAVLWRAADGKRLHQFASEDAIPRAFCFLSDGKALLACQKDTDLIFWDLAQNKKAFSPANPMPELPWMLGGLSLSPDGRYLAFNCIVLGREMDGAFFELSVWSCRTGQQLLAFHSRKKGPIAPAFSHDGRMLTAQDDKKSLVVRELPGGRVLSRLAVKADIVRAVAFSRDDHLLTVGQNDGKVSVWEIATGREVCCFEGKQRYVSSVAFAPDGRLLASASEDATVLVWDLAAWLRGGEPLTELSEAERQRLWADLRHPDAAVASRAVARLAAVPGQAVPLLKERLRPFVAEEERKKTRARQLVVQLDSDRFEERQKASTELEKMGRWAEPVLREALAGGPSPEAQRRIEALLKKPQPWSLSADGLQVLRSLQVLEQAGTAEGARMLEELAERLADERLRREARASWERVGHPSKPGDPKAGRGGKP